MGLLGYLLRALAGEYEMKMAMSFAGIAITILLTVAPAGEEIYVGRTACVTPRFRKNDSFSDGVSENAEVKMFHCGFTSSCLFSVLLKPRC